MGNKKGWKVYDLFIYLLHEQNMNGGGSQQKQFERVRTAMSGFFLCKRVKNVWRPHPICKLNEDRWAKQKIIFTLKEKRKTKQQKLAVCLSNRVCVHSFG